MYVTTFIKLKVLGSVTGFAAFRPIKFANKKIRQIFISVSRNIENLTLTVRLKLI